MSTKRKEVSGIDRAIAAAGSQAKIAADLGVKQQAVSIWKAKGFAPVKRAVEMEHLYGVPRVSMVSPKLLSVLDSVNNF
jgi:hypothetical protein